MFRVRFDGFKEKEAESCAKKFKVGLSFIE